ncbi:hypothetical protein Tco_0584170 [Tanacetum coccineum]
MPDRYQSEGIKQHNNSSFKIQDLDGGRKKNGYTTKPVANQKEETWQFLEYEERKGKNHGCGFVTKIQGLCFGFVEFEAPQAIQKAIEIIYKGSSPISLVWLFIDSLYADTNEVCLFISNPGVCIVPALRPVQQATGDCAVDLLNLRSLSYFKKAMRDVETSVAVDEASIGAVILVYQEVNGKVRDAVISLHVTTEGTTLVKHAEERRGWLTEQVFVRKVIELHDKYLAYVGQENEAKNTFETAARYTITGKVQRVKDGILLSTRKLIMSKLCSLYGKSTTGERCKSIQRTIGGGIKTIKNLFARLNVKLILESLKRRWSDIRIGSCKGYCL